MPTMTLEMTSNMQVLLSPARTRVSEKGRVVIPSQFREALGIKVGDVVNLEVVGDELRISTFASRLKRTRERLQKYATPGVLASDELIHERRREARKEEDEFLVLSKRLDDNLRAKG